MLYLIYIYIVYKKVKLWNTKECHCVVFIPLYEYPVTKYFNRTELDEWGGVEI